MQNIKAIIIEAGHGKPTLFGVDRGAKGMIGANIYYERDLAVKLAHKLYPLLAAKTTCPIYLVGVDTNATLAKKTAYINNLCEANNWKKSEVLSLSLHFNAGGGTGSEMYYANGALNFANSLEAAFEKYKIFPMRNNPVRPTSQDRLGRLYIDDWMTTAILLEPCFLDNAGDLKSLLVDFDRLAECIAHGTLNYSKL